MPFYVQKCGTMVSVSKGLNPTLIEWTNIYSASAVRAANAYDDPADPGLITSCRIDFYPSAGSIAGVTGNVSEFQSIEESSMGTDAGSFTAALVEIMNKV